MPRTAPLDLYAMNSPKCNAEAEVHILLRSRMQIDAIAAALGPEASHPTGEKANAKVMRRGQRLKIVFKARDSASLRAIVNSYLRMLKATTTVCGSLLEMESGQVKREATYAE